MTIRTKQSLAALAVLTLAATGSESNPHGVVTHAERQEKLPFFSPLLFPRFAILDPRCTFSLPPRQIGNGVVDAFVHILEQYLTFPVGGDVQDRLAEGLHEDPQRRRVAQSAMVGGQQDAMTGGQGGAQVIQSVEIKAGQAPRFFQVGA